MEKGIVSIKDLLKEDGSYLSFEEFKGKFSCKTNFIQYFQIISAIPDRLRLKSQSINSSSQVTIISFILKELSPSTLIKSNRGTSTIVSLIKPTMEVRPVLKDGAKHVLSLNAEHWAKIFKTTRKLCKDTKLK